MSKREGTKASDVRYYSSQSKARQTALRGSALTRASKPDSDERSEQLKQVSHTDGKQRLRRRTMTWIGSTVLYSKRRERRRARDVTVGPRLLYSLGASQRSAD